MSERYPNDAELLGLISDDHTGVEYIPTGRSPYYLEFRKLVQRLVLACGRANDLRVFIDGDLAVGVRAGRCVVDNQSVSIDETTAINVSPLTTTSVWIDVAGAIQTGESGFPSDRSTFIPLAQVVTDDTTITQLIDHRGEAFLMIPTTASLGLNATTAEIDQALSGINATVDRTALNALTAGPQSRVDSEHTHALSSQDVDDLAFFAAINDNAGANANIGIALQLPNVMPDGLLIAQDRGHGFATQSYNGTTLNLVASTHVQHIHAGPLTASISNYPIGCVTIDGEITDIVLSIGNNLVSSVGTDSVTATVRANGVAVTSTDPAIDSTAGAGFRSTDQGDGTAATTKSDGSELVTRGDLLTLDLTRTIAGTVTNEATDIVVLVIIRAGKPE